MTIRELKGYFVRYESREDKEYILTQDSANNPFNINNSQGLWILCPECFIRNKGPVGTHSIDISFRDRGVLDHQGSHNTQGQPSRWQISGTSLDDVTLSPSIDISQNNTICKWHGFIRNGKIE